MIFFLSMYHHRMFEENLSLTSVQFSRQRDAIKYNCLVFRIEFYLTTISSIAVTVACQRVNAGWLDLTSGWVPYERPATPYKDARVRNASVCQAFSYSFALSATLFKEWQLVMKVFLPDL